MQLKDLFALLAIPALCLASPIPQEEFSDVPEDSIVGGETAAQGQFNFIVSIQQNGGHFCGGSLINANTVVTAAHCATGRTAANLRVRAGSLNRASGGTLVTVSRIVIHPSYSSSAYDYDVAILKLATSIPTSSTVSYAALAAANSDPAGGTLTSVAGWGVTSQGGTSSPAALRKVDVPIISRADCRAQYGTSRVSNNMICAGLNAGGKDSCQGDSGGPLIDASTRVLVGIVSWGDGCAQAGAPGVYSRVGTLRSFITSY